MFQLENPQTGGSEHGFEFSVRQRAGMRTISNDFDAVIQLSNFRIFRGFDVDNSDPAAFFNHARHLRNHPGWIGNVVQAVAGDRQVQRIIGEGQSLRVANRKGQFIQQSFVRGRLARAFQNRRREVQAANPAHVFGEAQRQCSRPAGEIHRAVVGVGGDHARQRLLR